MNHGQYYIRKGIEEAASLLVNLDAYHKQSQAIQNMARIIILAFLSGGKVLVCGNGGSACDAMHFAEELTGRFRKNRRALPAISLTDSAHITCVGNDFGFEHVFSRAIEALGKPEDVLVCLSTSGNSKNVLLAVEQAKGFGMEVICLLGKGGGRLKGQGDVELIVPSQTSERVQEVHMLVLHLLVETIERELFPENYEGKE